jgi:hypothetical protein
MAIGIPQKECLADRLMGRRHVAKLKSSPTTHPVFLWGGGGGEQTSLLFKWPTLENISKT